GDTMDSLDFEMNATTNDGVVIPMKLKLEYPDGHGFTAVQAAKHALENNFGSIVGALAQQGDASLVAAMDRAGMTLAEDE
ncbi:MAG: hypothetical protein ACTHKE_04200, partial [Sphingomicrobium sp.]